MILYVPLGILAVIAIFIGLVHLITQQRRAYLAEWHREGNRAVGGCALDRCACASIRFFDRR